MRAAAKPFQVRINAVGWDLPRTFDNGNRGHLSLRDDALWSSGGFVEPLRLERDLVRIGFAIYAADRLVRRVAPKSFASPIRQIEVAVEVGQPDFWRGILPLLKEALGVLCDDLWDIRFTQGSSIHRQLPLFRQISGVEVIWQYSTGLDSAAGAIIRAAESSGQALTVTAMHQTHQVERAERHIREISNWFGKKITTSSARTTFGPLMHEFYPRFDYQELSQRCRAFLFMACGGAAASTLGAGRVEVFENGVGIINLPPMAGMAFGSRSTRGCHPRFLRLMSKIVSKVASRPIEFVLPFAGWTKGEMVSRASNLGLENILTDSMSCVHQLRVRGRAKHCGTCPACIGRRQAFFAAGLNIDDGQYRDDMFDSAQHIARDKLSFLAATLMQVIDLQQLKTTGSYPESFRRHIFGTGFLRSNESPDAWIQVLCRYRDEWLQLIYQQHAMGQRWAGLLPNHLVAA